MAEGSGSVCPFCQVTFKALGRHLPRCKQRKNREYKIYLSSGKSSPAVPKVRKEDFI